jgi:thioredoxin reductase
MSATLGAMEAGLKHVTVEQNSLGGTVAKFPRGKLVMTAPAHLPIVGEVNFREALKEELIGFWDEAQKKTGMKINTGERLVGIETQESGSFVVKTDKSSYKTRSVLLALGRRGTPRLLGVPGEQLPKVIYSLIDPSEYAGKSVLVVGGGDSALEAACSIAEEVGSTVNLSYRSDAFSRAKKKNRERVERLVASGNLQVLFGSTVKAIEPATVSIVQGDKTFELPNDAVIVCAGGILPTPLLEEIGIRMETKFGTS